MSQKWAIASKLLTELEVCGPPSCFTPLAPVREFLQTCTSGKIHTSFLVAEGFKYFDNDVRHCFALCTGVDATNSSWEQAQLSLSRGDIGLRSLSDHSAACYIASLVHTGIDQHLVHSIGEYNGRILPSASITIESVSHTPCCQNDLYCKLEDSQCNKLFASSSLPDRACQLSVSSPPCCSLAFCYPFSRA